MMFIVINFFLSFMGIYLLYCLYQANKSWKKLNEEEKKYVEELKRLAAKTKELNDFYEDSLNTSKARWLLQQVIWANRDKIDGKE